jgi:hypothetical protein
MDDFLAVDNCFHDFFDDGYEYLEDFVVDIALLPLGNGDNVQRFPKAHLL